MSMAFSDTELTLRLPGRDINFNGCFRSSTKRCFLETVDDDDDHDLDSGSSTTACSKSSSKVDDHNDYEPQHNVGKPPSPK